MERKLEECTPTTHRKCYCAGRAECHDCGQPLRDDYEESVPEIHAIKTVAERPDHLKGVTAPAIKKTTETLPNRVEIKGDIAYLQTKSNIKVNLLLNEQMLKDIFNQHRAEQRKIIKGDTE